MIGLLLPRYFRCSPQYLMFASERGRHILFGRAPYFGVIGGQHNYIDRGSAKSQRSQDILLADTWC